MAAADTNNRKNSNDKIGKILFVIHSIFIILSVILVGRIIALQLFYNPDPQIAKRIVPTVRKVKTEPLRGDILAKDGRLLAVSTPLYQVCMDCTVQKEYFKTKKDAEAKEKKWLDEARELSEGLARIYGDKSASEYYNIIASGRRNGKKYVRLGYKIDHNTLLKVKELPLFRKGANKGGIIVETEDSRIYPFGSLARRTIGYIQSNNLTNGAIGLEGRFNEVLHGEAGYEWTKITEHHGRIHNYDSTSVEKRNGYDLRTTLDIDMQDIADKALREMIANTEAAEGGCVIVMDVETGAIRTMVNLVKDKDGNIGETYNYSIGRAANAGSVFKTVGLMAALDDGYITSLEDSIATGGGFWQYGKKVFNDTEHLNKTRYPSGYITYSEALKISSNNVFRQLVTDNYKKDPSAYYNKIAKYGVFMDYDFDLEGLAKTKHPDPKNRYWSPLDLPTSAIGYSIAVTPLHIISFYNAIANGGVLMKPYLVESIEKNGKVVKKRGAEKIDRICRKATADTLMRGLRKVVADKGGTGYRTLGKCLCAVAGKTGTAWREVDGGYEIKQYIGSFVGIFPYENPKYTVMCAMYSKKGAYNFYGATYAGPVVREIVNSTYAMDAGWGDTYGRITSVPKMRVEKPEIGLDRLDIVPDVKGLGLSDAMYSIENCGYKCVYEGRGKVRSQSPAAGTKAAKGSTVTITMK